MRSSRAVSYTHLDVYKRQGLPLVTFLVKNQVARNSVPPTFSKTCTNISMKRIIQKVELPKPPAMMLLRLNPVTKLMEMVAKKPGQISPTVDQP